MLDWKRGIGVAGAIVADGGAFTLTFTACGGPAARSAAALQALLGQFYLAVLVARPNEPCVRPLHNRAVRIA